MELQWVSDSVDKLDYLLVGALEEMTVLMMVV